MKSIVKIKKLHEDAKIPSFAYEYDAGLDIFSIEDGVIKSGERAIIKTGIALEIPPGYVGLVWDRGSVGMKSGIKTLGGVVDAGYRGEVAIGLVNLSQEAYEIKKGDKIAQLLIQKVEHPEIEVADDLSESERADRRFGSSGK